MSCIRALDWMPGCSWPLWLQCVVGVIGAFACILAWHAWQRRHS